MIGYQVTEKAKEDLINIWLYTNETWSTEQADYYYDLIIDEFQVIVTNPFIGKAYDSIQNGMRGLIINAHTIFYEILPEGIIEIVRILNHNEDISNKL